MPSFEEFVAEIRPLWDTRWLSNRGALHRRLESELGTRFQTSNIALFSNGHLALEAIIEAFELTGEVITTPFTFASTSHALVRKGLTPVFADIREEDFTLDPASIEALITPRTTAILPVHVYGNLCDVDEIQRIADQHGLKVIYDAAHSFGVTRNGRSSAMFGDASMFSFHATKVFHTIEGGAAVVKDPQLVERLYELQNFGITGPESISTVGGNAKLNELAAAMGLCNLRMLDDEIARRKTAYDTYRDRLDGVAGLYIPSIGEGVVHNYPYLPVQINPKRFGANRDEVFAALAVNGVGARKYFAPLVSEFDAYEGRFDPADTPIALRISREILALPLYANLSVEDVNYICDALLAAGVRQQ
jgi:dTDP-4-amino-4,6-dideoxygalactose transaminase